MNVPACFLAVSLIIGFPASLPAKEKNHAPLPQRIITAKTVYVDNRSDDASISDKAHNELKKWGRFRIVQDKAQADLVFVFTSGEYTSYTTNNPPYTAEVKEGYTYLTVVDAQSDQHLWNASQKWGKRLQRPP